VIGDAPQARKHLFGQGYSLAAVIANEFGGGPGPAPLGAVAAGWCCCAHAASSNGARARAVNRGFASEQTSAPQAAVGPGPGRRSGWAGAMKRAEPSSERSRACAVSPARRRKDKLARGAITAGTVIALIPLVLVL